MEEVRCSERYGFLPVGGREVRARRCNLCRRQYVFKSWKLSRHVSTVETVRGGFSICTGTQSELAAVACGLLACRRA